MFDWLRKIWLQLFGKNYNSNESIEDENSSKTEIEQKPHFCSVLTLEKTPLNKEINEGEFVQVVYEDKPIWAMFKCPCGCGFVISLSLQKVHNPSWRLSKNANNYPTLYPSVWRDNGCYSHFWIEEGKVIWCDLTGVPPSD